ncbi:MAG: DegV family protein [Clostridiales bacterium]|nr:DegV family protein [Clostridiales bacterium]
MAKYVIITDSSSDLTAENREKYNVEYIPNRFYYKDKEYDADLDWKSVPMDEFFDYLRAGNRILTSQISSLACKETFEKWLKAGYDVLSISCPGVLSATAKVFFHTRDELQPQYPDRKIISIDATVSSGGLRMLCIKAAMLRQEGKTIDEVAAWVEENKKRVHQEGSVDNLSYLKRAGRISAVSAFFGGLLHIKPMIISDVHGYNVAVEKVKGRKASIERTVERVIERYKPTDYPDIFVQHTACEEDAKTLKSMLQERLGLSEDKIHIGPVNTVMAASVGPGMFGVYFFGEEVTYDSKA